MADADSRLHVDDDWKAEARREKERLEEQQAPAGRRVDASFVGLIDMLAMQVIVSLGGMAGPGGEEIPPNPAAAKHFIDMIQVLEDKTRGNLSDDEKKHMDRVLYEVRMQYVHSVSGPAAVPPML